MKKVIKLTTAFLVLSFLLSSCNLPFFRGGRAEENNPPNLTLTALFDTSMNIPPSMTPALPTSVEVIQTTLAIVLPTLAGSDSPTPNPIPTNTSAPPTAEVRQRSGKLMKAAYL